MEVEVVAKDIRKINALEGEVETPVAEIDLTAAEGGSAANYPEFTNLLRTDKGFSTSKPKLLVSETPLGEMVDQVFDFSKEENVLDHPTKRSMMSPKGRTASMRDLDKIDLTEQPSLFRDPTEHGTMRDLGDGRGRRSIDLTQGGVMSPKGRKGGYADEKDHMSAHVSNTVRRLR